MTSFRKALPGTEGSVEAAAEAVRWPATRCARPFWQAVWTLCALAGLTLPPGANGGAPVLVGANRVSAQFAFQISGESNVAYIVETSTNLQSWKPVLTNSDPAKCARSR